MSLVSRIANIFSPLQPQVVPDKSSSPSSQSASTSLEGGQPRRLRNARLDQNLSMEEEEEVRHPYIHVS